MSNAPRSFGYARVSSRGQAESGLGEEAQRTTIRRCHDQFLDKAGYEFKGVWFDAAVSAGSVPFLERDEGAKLNRELRRGDAVIVAKVDRAFRRLHDLLNTVHIWTERGVRVIFADMQGQDIDLASLAGKAVMFALGFAAEVEWCRASERCKDKASAARAQGRPVNQVAPFGFKIGSRGQQRILYPNVEQRAFAEQVAQWYESGRSLREIAAHLKSLEESGGHAGVLTTNHHAVWRWIRAHRELCELEAANGITFRDPERWVLPNGKVVTIDYFPKQIREALRPAPN